MLRRRASHCCEGSWELMWVCVAQCRKHFFFPPSGDSDSNNTFHVLFFSLFRWVLFHLNDRSTKSWFALKCFLPGFQWSNKVQLTEHEWQGVAMKELKVEELTRSLEIWTNKKIFLHVWIFRQKWQFVGNQVLNPGAFLYAQQPSYSQIVNCNTRWKTCRLTIKSQGFSIYSRLMLDI